VVSADSRQVYKGLDISTAKPTRRERHAVPHHGLDLIRPGERYSAGRFARDAVRWIEEIRGRGRQPVIVGGTGLYVRALAEGLFREPPLDAARRRELETWTAGLDALELVRWAARLDSGFQGGGRQRAMRAVEVALLSGRSLSAWQAAARGSASVRPWYVRLTVPRDVLHQRIRRRAQVMLERGMIEEVAAALADGAAAGAPGLDGVGVREAVSYLGTGGDRAELLDAITISTRQYAKRQETWFRHQVPGEAFVVDAVDEPTTVAARIAAAWSHDARRATDGV
jgi:tRNA dimethylallyltransferase